MNNLLYLIKQKFLPFLLLYPRVYVQKFDKFEHRIAYVKTRSHKIISSTRFELEIEFFLLLKDNRDELS